MKRDEIQQYENKLVFIKLKNNFFYTAKILKINNESINILDKYHLNSTINIDDIVSISELKKEAKE